uniref:Uncharacterized protein n=1 Tax=viral metagenome TaxID=1070528 RepID=A0A6C0KSK5_9ZZZZ
MNSCNARGFLQLGGGDIASFKNLKDSFTPIEHGYKFVISDSFDVFQNAHIKVKGNVILDVYLKNESESFLLGTTDYPIFPNTSFPPSYPLFCFRKRDFYLFIPTERSDYKIEITYDASLLKKEAMQKLTDPQYPYASYYLLSSDKLYNFEKDAVHKPIETSIDY